MHAAYKHADGKKIDGRRVLVDVERGRTVKGWLPRRLGGGLGGTRRGADHENTRHSGRDDTRSRRDDGRRRSRSRDRRRSRSNERRRSRSRDRSSRKRSRSRDRKRSKRSRSRSRERRRKERKEEGGIKVKDEPMDYKNEPEDGSNFDLQGVNVKQEQENGDGMNGAGADPTIAAADRNLPTAAPGEEGEYGY